MFLNRENLSRECLSWGWSCKDTKERNECIRKAINGNGFGDADTGSLARIANALEEIVTLLDPKGRAERMRQQQEEKEEEVRQEHCQIRDSNNWRRIRPFLDRYLDKLQPRLDLLVSKGESALARRIELAVRRTTGEFTRFPTGWSGRRLNKILRGDPMMLHEIRLHGIGPVSLAKWAKAEGRAA